MTNHTHILGFPRIGAARELKFALERHWRGEQRSGPGSDGPQLRARHWAQQRDAGLDFVTVGDFAFYDQVANHIQLLGCEPARYHFSAAIALSATSPWRAAQHAHSPRRLQPRPPRAGRQRHALEMTKWFDTNYHYLVPEFTPLTAFAGQRAPVRRSGRGAGAGPPVKAVLIGPSPSCGWAKPRRLVSTAWPCWNNCCPCTAPCWTA
jgi:5-methyltetrahydropteroyltriglutamate--homocysteine methyltransferase